MSPTTDTIFGILLAILAAAMFTVGAIGQKKAVQDLPEIKMSDISTMTNMVKNKAWAISTVIGLLGGLPYILSQIFIGIGYTQLLMATGLILLAFLATRTLNESLGKLEWSGIIIILVGTVLLGLAQLSDVNVTLSTPGLFTNALIFYIIFGVAIATGLLLYRFTDWGAAKNMAINSGIWFGVGACSSQIGSLGLEEGNILIAFIGFLVLIGGNVIGTVVVQIAFQKGKAIMAIPLQSAGNYLIPVFAGIILFQQIFLYSFLFWPSVILIMCGVFLLSRIQAEIEETADEGPGE
jgi:drug/metabolite transporter (DMT)-like permease